MPGNTDSFNTAAQSPSIVDASCDAYWAEEGSNEPLSPAAQLGASFLMSKAIIEDDLEAARAYLHKGATLAFLKDAPPSNPVLLAIGSKDKSLINEIIERIKEDDIKSFNNLYDSLALHDCIDQLDALCKRFPPPEQDLVDAAKRLIAASKNETLRSMAKKGLFETFTEENWQSLKQHAESLELLFAPIDEIKRFTAEKIKTERNQKMVEECMPRVKQRLKKRSIKIR